MRPMMSPSLALPAVVAAVGLVAAKTLGPVLVTVFEVFQKLLQRAR